MLAQLSSGDISLMFGVSLPLLAFDSHELVDMFYITEPCFVRLWLLCYYFLTDVLFL